MVNAATRITCARRRQHWLENALNSRMTEVLTTRAGSHRRFGTQVHEAPTVQVVRGLGRFVNGCGWFRSRNRQSLTQELGSAKHGIDTPSVNLPASPPCIHGFPL